MKVTRTILELALGASLLTGAAATQVVHASGAPSPTASSTGAAIPQASPAGTAAELRAQVEANRLTPAEARSLQAQVDEVVARTGGTQVAINQVRWDGGDTLLPLPGESRARELGESSVSAPPTVHGCKYLQFCTYSGENYTGVLDRMQSCVLHTTHLGPNGEWFHSYVNNQTRGTRARFYGAGMQLWSYSKPAPDKGTTSLGLQTFYIRPC